MSLPIIHSEQTPMVLYAVTLQSPEGRHMIHNPPPPQIYSSVAVSGSAFSGPAVGDVNPDFVGVNFPV